MQYRDLAAHVEEIERVEDDHQRSLLYLTYFQVPVSENRAFQRSERKSSQRKGNGLEFLSDVAYLDSLSDLGPPPPLFPQIRREMGVLLAVLKHQGVDLGPQPF